VEDNILELSQYVLQAFREDEKFVLYRGKHSNQPSSPSVLLLAPASTREALETVRKIEHEYSLRDELDSGWAVGSPGNAGGRRFCSKTRVAKLSFDSFQGRGR
jgi:hypothetical protein